MKKVVNFFKKIVFGFLFIFTFNKLAIPINIVVPMNVITIGLVSFLGVPAMFMLVLFLILYVR